MLLLAENLKALRKRKDITQEDVAESLGVSAQSVSKWERGDTLPDITLLPALANLYQTSVDRLLGMDKINDVQARPAVFTSAHGHLRRGEYGLAVAILKEACKTFPNDDGLLSDLAIALALDSDHTSLREASALCGRALSGQQSEKVRHTTRAALCCIHWKAGEKEKAVQMAKSLPHVRECRETILALFGGEPSAAELDAHLLRIAIGETSA